VAPPRPGGDRNPGSPTGGGPPHPVPPPPPPRPARRKVRPHLEPPARLAAPALPPPAGRTAPAGTPPGTRPLRDADRQSTPRWDVAPADRGRHWKAHRGADVPAVLGHDHRLGDGRSVRGAHEGAAGAGRRGGGAPLRAPA